jgi:hypothetical protein
MDNIHPLSSSAILHHSGGLGKFHLGKNYHEMLRDILRCDFDENRQGFAASGFARLHILPLFECWLMIAQLHFLPAVPKKQNSDGTAAQRRVE